MSARARTSSRSRSRRSIRIRGTFLARARGGRQPARRDYGAAQLPTGLAGPDAIADIKGRTMLIDHYKALFDAPVRS